MKNLLLILSIILSLTVSAQEDIKELITDRPDQTESSSVVPTGMLQIESGFLMEYDEIGSISEQTLTYNSTLLRYGLFNNFELRAGLEYAKYRKSFGSDVEDFTGSGMTPFYAGFKIKFLEEDGWIPEAAFLGGISMPFTADKLFKTSFTSSDLRFSFGHTLTDKVSLGYNLGMQWDGETGIPGYYYSFALGRAITDKLSMYIEAFGLITEKNEAEHLADAGFTFLLAPNLQLDISGGIGLNEEASDSYFGFGVSYRLPE
jgi:hypothetical protein